jgi:hypothetical protein
MLQFSDFTCPTNMSTPTSGFREIQGKCYFMTKGGCHNIYHGCKFQHAQNQCKTVFGSGISGHLFEPTSLEINNAVLKAAEDVMGHSRWFWIGVYNGKFIYWVFDFKKVFISSCYLSTYLIQQSC